MILYNITMDDLELKLIAAKQREIVARYKLGLAIFQLADACAERKRIRGKAMKEANYIVNSTNQFRIILSDVGPWDKYTTVTNAAEWVIEDLNRHYNIAGRRVFYYDSEGDYSEILIKNGKFAGFKHAEEEEEED